MAPSSRKEIHPSSQPHPDPPAAVVTLPSLPPTSYPYPPSSSKPSKPRLLRRKAIRLAVRDGTRRSAAARPLREHETGATEDRGIVLVLLLPSLAGLALLIILRQRLDDGNLLAHEVDEEGHGEVGEAVAPGDFHHHVEPDELVAGVEHADVAFAAADVDELGRGGFVSSGDCD